MQLVHRFIVEEHGAETVEYALVLGLIGLAAIAGLTSAGSAITSWWNKLGVLVSSETGSMP